MKFNLQSLYGWYSNAIRNPKYRWWIILGTLIYLLSPFDLAPDWFPLAGQIDDFLVVSIMLSEVSQIIMSGIKNKKNQQSSPDITGEETKTVDVDAVSID
jgi:uncharacterized membrane protein YkvA (DUF1232 family)